MNIFDKKNKEPIRVPEIEIRGDELSVRPQSPEAEDQSYKLPKTKWF